MNRENYFINKFSKNNKNFSNSEKFKSLFNLFKGLYWNLCQYCFNNYDIFYVIC